MNVGESRLLASYSWKIGQRFPRCCGVFFEGTRRTQVTLLCVGLKLSSLIWIPFPSFSLWNLGLSATHPASYHSVRGQGHHNGKRRLMTQAFSVFGHTDVYLQCPLPLPFSFLLKMGFGLCKKHKCGRGFLGAHGILKYWRYFSQCPFTFVGRYLGECVVQGKTLWAACPSKAWRTSLRSIRCPLCGWELEQKRGLRYEKQYGTWSFCYCLIYWVTNTEAQL